MAKIESGQGVGLAFIRMYYDDPVAHDFWPFYIRPSGYADVKIDHRSRRAHIIACELAHGPKPSPEHQVAHAPGCHNKHCYYAGHLRWATPAENSADRIADGTQVRGETSGMAKLTETQVIEIRLRWLTAENTQAELAEEYGVSTALITRIARGLIWKHVWENFSVFDEVA